MKSTFGWYENQLSPKVNSVDTECNHAMRAKEEPQKVLEVLQKSRMGRIHYDTGWDTQPFSMLKLISEVQAEGHRYLQRNLERAVAIVENTESNGEENRRASYSILPTVKSLNTTSNDVTTPFYTANNTLTSPDKEIVDSATPSKTSKGRLSLKNVKFIGIADDYDEEADSIALATQSPIFAQFEKLSAKYEQGRIASWLSLCREKAIETAAIERRHEAVRKEQEEKSRRENEERRKARAKEREKSRLDLEKRITEQRRRLELESKMQEQEFNRMRQQQVEKEKLDLLEAQRKKEEEESAKILAQEEAAKLKAEAEVMAAKLLKEKNDAAVAQSQTLQKASEGVEVATGQQQRNDQALQKPPSKIPAEFIGAVLESDLRKYVRSQQLLNDITAKVAHISSTSQKSKTFYFAAMKVVNTPLNAISNLSPSHLQTKINHFYNLLDGRPVYVGDTMTSPFLSSSETEGNTFVLNLLAYRFVKKSEAEMTKGDKSAAISPLATLGAQLARKYPHWSEIVRAYFYKLCPFLVPFNYPRKDMSIQQYAVAIGQDVSGNERAVQQIMLERIGGYCTLYALMVVQFEKIRGGEDSHNEFFTLSEVWRILAAALKVEPQLDVTATVLHTILEAIGDKLATTFKIQFRKYLQQLTDSYLTKISQVTPPGKAAALTRLELFLESKAATWFR